MIDASELLARAQPFIGWKASGISAMVEELCAAIAAKEAATKEAIEWLEETIAAQAQEIEQLHAIIHGMQVGAIMREQAAQIERLKNELAVQAQHYRDLSSSA
jgi:LDH2 family malate/lactate/ureidoglycolate dehydrogenase